VRRSRGPAPTPTRPKPNVGRRARLAKLAWPWAAFLLQYRTLCFSTARHSLDSRLGQPSPKRHSPRSRALRRNPPCRARRSIWSGGGAASWPWTNHRVGGVRLKGCRLVRHDGSTARANPTVNLALPAPHAPTPSTPNMLHCPLGMPSTDPCRPSASRPSPSADGICLLDLSAGLNQRRSPAGGRSGARRGARASSSSTRAVGRAAQGGHQFSRLASL